MAAFAKPELRLAQPTGWFDQLAALLARELAPSSRKFRTAFRLTTIATLGAGLVAICHVNNELGTYIVWLLVGAGPMMSVRKAAAFLIAEALALVSSVVIARTLAETPWLMLPFLFALLSFSTYLGMIRKLGAPLPPHRGGLPRYFLWRRVCASGDWLERGRRVWRQRDRFRRARSIRQLAVARSRRRDPAGIAGSERRARSFAASRGCKFLSGSPKRAATAAATADFGSSRTHGSSESSRGRGCVWHRHAILLAAVTRVARIGLEVDRLTFTARQNVPAKLRAMVRPEIQATIKAIAAVLDEFARELPTHIAVGVDQPAPAPRTRARLAIDVLSARIIQIRPAYIGKASSAEIENFAAFTDSLAGADRTPRASAR